MVVKKNITVEEVHDDGKKKIVYQGEDKRYYDTNYKPSMWGIPLSDWVKMVVFIVGIITVGNTYIQKNDTRIAVLEGTSQDLTDKLTKVSQSLQDYMEASDGWHSSTTGTQFKAGKPIDGGYRTSGNRGYIRKKPEEFIE